MPTVNMPRGDWEELFLIMETAMNSPTSNLTPFLVQVLKERIEDQVYSQEY